MKKFTPEEIRSLRGELSRSVFGLVICVDEDTIRRWEIGKLKPNDSRHRLMRILSENNEIYKKIVIEVQCETLS